MSLTKSGRDYLNETQADLDALIIEQINFFEKYIDFIQKFN